MGVPDSQETMSSPASAAGSPRTEQRRRAILDVASQAFLEDGFAATSMSSIASRLGGSKATLYSYFRSKEDLFSAFMTDACGGPANVLFEHLSPISGEVRTTLVELGVAYVRFNLSDPVTAIHRLVVAEAGRFPAIGRLFYETGPMKGEQRLRDYFAAATSDGHLRRADPTAMARRFRDLSLSDIYTRRLWGVVGETDDAEVRASVAEGVDIFLAYYGS